MRLLLDAHVSGPRVGRQLQANGHDVHSEFDLIVRGIQRWLDLYPEPAKWIDLAAVLDRDFASG